ncbi:MAG TPA: hypothetical protein VNZ26_35925 [Vicinamibacterales bacterium]|jgi:hypothetical protein|nr:hypothetical protein [Vicinamibacterales bacterium]
MDDKGTLRGQIQEQQRLIEEQRVEIQRQQSQIELQFRRTAAMQVQLDRIQVTLQQAAPILHPTKERPSNGNGRNAAPTSSNDLDEIGNK